ncbi:uncharacterized protein LOC125378869 [Haliotis rufescens]|uniref:uncharacterized protein LOC125378869 n=1 Tax=Haliotis rufescens TaxID=6454 RepID=UPI00201F5CC0|nr:uncharacterized protein LOC125378869 [Haliotis rufescens]
MNAIPGGLGHTVDNRRDQAQKTMFLRLVLWIALPAGIQAVGDSKNNYADSKEQKTPDGYWFVTSLLNNTRMIITIFDVELHNIALAIDEQGIEAIDFHGTPTSFVKIPNNGDWNGDNAFTWCFLLYTDVEQTAIIMEYEGVTGAADGVRLTLQGTNITGQVFDKNGSVFGSHTHDGLKLSSWNYVLFSYNNIWGHIDVQINDIMQGDFRSSPGVEANALGDIKIGGSVDGTGPFKGKIACIQFYEVAFLKKGLLEVDNFYMAALNERKELLNLAGVEEIEKEVNDFATSKKQEAPAAFWPISSTLNHDGEVEKSSFLMELHDAELIQMGTGAEAVELKGTPTSYVTIPNDGGLNGVSAFSWFLKIYPKAEQRATILEYAGADGCGDGLRLLQSGTNLTVVMYNEHGHPYGEYARDVLIINQWNFIGITYNKYWGHIDIIYNKDDTYFETFNLQVSTNAVGDITIGSSVNGTDPFHGNINCIQFYNKTLFKAALDHLTDFCDPALLTNIAWANGHTTVSSSTSTPASTGTVTYTATDTATDTTTNTATDTTTDTTRRQTQRQTGLHTR